MKASFIDDAIANDRQIKDLELLCSCKSTITWFRIPNTSWTAAQAKAQRDQATTWFDKYCIHLKFEKISFNVAKPREAAAKRDLNNAVQKYLQVVATIPHGVAVPAAVLDRAQHWLLKIDSAIRKKVGGKRIVVIFLEEWFVKTGVTSNPAHWRKYRVSATDGARLLIGLDRYDRTGRNVLTHELLHALRKKVHGGSNRPCVRAFVRQHHANHPDVSRRWPDHYGGANQDKAMSRPNRAGAFRPMNMQDSRVLTITEYLMMMAAGSLKCGQGCVCIAKTPKGRTNAPAGKKPKTKPRRPAKKASRRTKPRRR